MGNLQLAMREIQFAASAILALMAPMASAQTIYATGFGYGSNFGGGRVYRTQAGSNVLQSLIATGVSNQPIMVSTFNDHLYWSMYSPPGIWRSNINGSNPVAIVTSPPRPSSYTRAIEFFEGRMFWSDEGLGAIFSANPDGSDKRTVVSGYFGSSQGIWDFTICNSRIYWTSWVSSTFKSVAMDGSDFRQTSLTGRVFSIESTSDQLIFNIDKKVVTTDLAGGNLQIIADRPAASELTALDVFNGRAYFGYTGGGSLSRIESITLSGTGVRNEMVNAIASDAPSLFQIHVVPTPGAALALLAWVCLPSRRRGKPSTNLM